MFAARRTSYQALLHSGSKRRLPLPSLFASAAALALVVGQLGVGRPRNAIARIPHPQGKSIVEGHRKGKSNPLYLVPHAGLYQQASTGHSGKVRTVAVRNR